MRSSLSSAPRLRRGLRALGDALPAIRRRVPAEAAVALPAVLAALARGGTRAPQDWRVHDWHAAADGLVLACVGPPATRARLVIRFATAPRAWPALARSADGLALVGALALPARSRAITPALLGRGQVEAVAWSAESFLPGRRVPGPVDVAEHHDQVTRIAAAVAPIHEAGAAALRVTDGVLDTWLHRRVALIEALVRQAGVPARASIDRIATTLEAALRGRELPVTVVHGDLWGGNVLEAPARAGAADSVRRIAGIVDWDAAADAELALHDHLHLALFNRKVLERRPLGEVVAEAIRRDGLHPDDAAMLGPAVFDPLEPRAALLLYWLRQVELNDLRNPALTRSPRWRNANVERVLACI